MQIKCIRIIMIKTCFYSHLRGFEKTYSVECKWEHRKIIHLRHVNEEIKITD